MPNFLKSRVISAKQIEAATRPNPICFIFIGESNTGGIALNSDAATAELAPNSRLQIWNNDNSVFEALNIGVNNLLGHSGLTGVNDAGAGGAPRETVNHGWELQLSERTKVLKTLNPSYLVKCGQGGSRVVSWGSATGNYTTFESRLAGAKAHFAANNLTVDYVVWVSLGINDAVASTSIADYETGLTDFLTRVEASVGPGIPFIVSKFMLQHSIYNETIEAIANTKPNWHWIETKDADRRDGNHWNYRGMKLISDRYLYQTLGVLGHNGTDTIGSLLDKHELVPPVDHRNVDFTNKVLQGAILTQNIRAGNTDGYPATVGLSFNRFQILNFRGENFTSIGFNNPQRFFDGSDQFGQLRNDVTGTIEWDYTNPLVYWAGALIAYTRTSVERAQITLEGSTNGGTSYSVVCQIGFDDWSSGDGSMANAQAKAISLDLGTKNYNHMRLTITAENTAFSGFMQFVEIEFRPFLPDIHDFPIGLVAHHNDTQRLYSPFDGLALAGNSSQTLAIAAPDIPANSETSLGTVTSPGALSATSVASVGWGTVPNSSNIALKAVVTGNDTVEVFAVNPTAGAIALGTGNLIVKVIN